jgi:hypothetical protein
VAVGLWLVATSLIHRPTRWGDAGEYYLMTESFVRHLSPEARPADVVALAAKLRRQNLDLNYARSLTVFFPDEQGRRYCYHFWGYSLACLPARGLVRLLQLPGLKAAQLTNALILLVVLHQALFAARLGRLARATLALLTLFSPIAWYLSWAHPETACASLVLLALVWSGAGRPVAATLAAALAATQNPPLVLFVAVLWLRAWLPALPAVRRLPRETVKRLALASLAALPAALPPLFYLWKLGSPSPLARVSTSTDLLSLRRALELFLDPNIGLLPYLPLTLLLFVAASLFQLLRRVTAARAAERLVLVFLMALASTVTHNWNGGSAGPSRYTVWLLPFLLMAVAEQVDAWQAGGPARRRLAVATATAAVCAQAFAFCARGGLIQPEDSIEHSYASRFVLRLAPSLYNPTPTIFVTRTLHRTAFEEFAVFRDADGRCRKAFARAKDGAALLLQCGSLPPGSEAYFARTTRRKFYRYLDY